MAEVAETSIENRWEDVDVGENRWEDVDSSAVSFTRWQDIKQPEVPFAARNPHLAALGRTMLDASYKTFIEPFYPRNLLGSLELAGRPMTALESGLLRYAQKGREAGPVAGLIEGGKQAWETLTAPLGESKIYTAREYYKEVTGEEPPMSYEWLWHTSTGVLWGLSGAAIKGPQALKVPLTETERLLPAAEKLPKPQKIIPPKEPSKVLKKILEPEEDVIKKGMDAWFKKEKNFLPSKGLPKRPYQGLEPGTNKWVETWERHPELQEEMLEYKRAAENARVYLFGGGEAMPNQMPKYAGSINLNRIEAAEDVKKLILDVSKNIPKKKMTLAEIREYATEIGMPLSKIKKMKKATDELAGEITAARDVLNQSAREVVEAQKLAYTTPTDLNIAKFGVLFHRHAQIQREVGGISSEIGRALSAHRILSETKAIDLKTIDRIMESLGGKELTAEKMRRLAEMDFGDIRSINKFILEADKATTFDMIYEAWINSILSGLPTHAVNITSNAFVRMFTLPEKGIRAPIDFLRSKITRTPRERYLDEVTADLFGMVEGIKEGTRRGLKSFISEIPESGISKLEVMRVRKAIPGVTGEIIRIPGKGLIAADEFFKAINFHAEIRSLAARQAIKEGLKGRARVTRIAEILENPGTELTEKATEEMLYRVFQKPFGPGGKAINRLRGVIPGLRYIIPFLRTPINIAKFGLERTPANFLRIGIKGAQKQLKSGELVDELAKATTGSILGLTTFLYAREGKVTGGGPAQKGRRQAKYRLGWQPYSIKVGDKYYSYGRFEPLGMIMGLSADTSEIWDSLPESERKELVGLISLAITKNLTNKTFLRGLSDAMNAIQDPIRYGNRWEYGFAGSWIPNMVATTARALDPGLKRPESHVEALKQRIPILREQVQTQLNLWGKEIKPSEAMTLLQRLISPMYISKASENPIDKEIDRMKLDIGMPGREKMGIRLSNEEYWFYVETAGNWTKDQLMQQMKTPLYISPKSNDFIRGKIIKDYIRAGRNFAWNELWKSMSMERKKDFIQQRTELLTGTIP